MLKAYALNPFAALATLRVLTADGKAVPLVDGEVRAFLAKSNTPTAEPADPALDVEAAHLGNGRWLIAFEADDLTPARVSAFPEAGGEGSFSAVLIIESAAGRVYADVALALSKPVESVT